MRRIEAMQPLLLKKLEEIEAVWVEKREGGRAPHGKRRLLHTPLGVASTSGLLRKATGFVGDIYGYETPGSAGGGLPSAFASSAEKLTADEIGPLTGCGASDAGQRFPASLAGNGPLWSFLRPDGFTP